MQLEETSTVEPEQLSFKTSKFVGLLPDKAGVSWSDDQAVPLLATVNVTDDPGELPELISIADADSGEMTR